MNKPFLALITPLATSGAHPEHPIVLPPEGQPPVGGQPPHPSHPIVEVPAHPIVLPPDGGVVPPLVIWGPTDPRPTPPIYIPVIPPPTAGNPHPEHPIYIPVYPAHPIVLPEPPEGGGRPPQLPPDLIQGITDAIKQKLIDFWTGNLPVPPGETVQPV